MRSANSRMNCWRIIERGARESNIRISKTKNEPRTVKSAFCKLIKGPGTNAKISPVTSMVIENVRGIIPFSSEILAVDVPAARKKSICILRSIRRKEIALTVVDRAWRSARMISRLGGKIVTFGLHERLKRGDDVKHTWRSSYPCHLSGIVNSTHTFHDTSMFHFSHAIFNLLIVLRAPLKIHLLRGFTAGRE